jgi:hypothetical protein
VAVTDEGAAADFGREAWGAAIEGGDDFTPGPGTGEAGGAGFPAKEGFSGEGGDVFKKSWVVRGPFSPEEGRLVEGMGEDFPPEPIPTTAR